MKTTFVSVFLVWANLLSGFGAEPLVVGTENNPISTVEIQDFNWETGVTTTFKISPDRIEVSTDEAEPYKDFVKPSDKGKEFLGKCLSGIGMIYVGDYDDAQVVDGVSIKFTFTLQNGSRHSTKLNNVRIESYAELTRRVSDLVERDIQYHQYKLKMLPSHQGGTDQPAAAPESKSEGKDKPQPKKEAAPR